MRGGNANVRPSEYYGGDSGNYSENPSPAGGSAYGQIVPVSHGEIRDNVAGPNLAVYPGGGNVQTGGGKRCSCASKKSMSRRDTRRSTRRGGRRVSRRRNVSRRSTRRGPRRVSRRR
jgi:hypothetical protein